MITNDLGKHQQQHKINGSNNQYDVNTKVNKFKNKEIIQCSSTSTSTISNSKNFYQVWTTEDGTSCVKNKERIV